MPLKSNTKRLVLSRNAGERVVIRVGSLEIVVGVDEARASKARLWFDAPETVKILRSEIAGPMPKSVTAYPLSASGDQHRG